MAYLRCSQGFLCLMMAGKVIDFGCVLREYSLTAELNSPVKCSFALRVQPFSKTMRCFGTAKVGQRS